MKLTSLRVKNSKAQSGLEVILLVGGVVILAAASYFVMKGFVLTGGESTQETMSRGSDVAREDLLNLGIQQVELPRIQWYSLGSRIKNNFTLTNQGSDPVTTNVSLKKASFESNGVDVGEFEIGFLEPVSSQYEVLGFTENTTDFVFETPVIPAGEDLEVVLHYNNSSPYTPVTSFEYSVENPDVVLVEESVESTVKTDFSPPVFEEIVIDTPGAGVGETVRFSVPVNESSQVSEASFNITLETESGNFSTTSFDAGGLYHVVSGLPGGSMQVRGSYSSGSIMFEMVPPTSGEYSFSCTVVDEWGNTGTTVVVLNVSDEGTVQKEESISPVISNPQPSNNSFVNNIALLDINITTDENSHCRYSNESGNDYADMTDFNVTDSTSHQLTEVNISEDKSYTFYFKCNDSLGNVNLDDYELSFVKNYFSDNSERITFNDDTAGYGGGYIDVDENDDLHVFFFNVTSLNAAYLNRTNGAWNPSVNIAPARGQISDLEVFNSTRMAGQIDGYGSGSYHYYIFNRDEGTSNQWIKSVELGSANYWQDSDLAVDSLGRFHLVYDICCDKIEYRNYDSSWSSIITLSSGPFVNGYHSSWPKVEVDSQDKVHVVWGEHDWKINYMKIDRTGSVIVSEKTVIPDLQPGLDLKPLPDFAIDSNDDLHVVWQDFHTTNPEVYYSKLDSIGDNLTGKIRLSYGYPLEGTWRGPPRVKIDSQDRIHVVYCNTDTATSSHYIRYFRLGDDGTVFCNATKITDEIGSCNPTRLTLAIDSNDVVHVAYPSNITGSWDVYYRNITPSEYLLCG